MQYPRNTSRRLLEYQSRINRAAVSSEPAANYIREKETIAVQAPISDETSMNALSQRPLSLAMAYVPYQEFRELNEPEAALAAGTLFRELDKPFYGPRGRSL